MKLRVKFDVEVPDGTTDENAKASLLANLFGAAICDQLSRAGKHMETVSSQEGSPEYRDEVLARFQNCVAWSRAILTAKETATFEQDEER